MNKGFKRIAASFLSAAMLFQQCAVTGIAEEQEGSEVQTQAAETQAPEAQAQAETQASETRVPEAQAQAETQVSETQAPETQAPETQAAETQAPETQAPETQAPTESETQAPETQASTEPETQVPETQAPTEPETQASTENETQAPTETETQAPTETETQAPTETETQAPTETETQAQTETETQQETETETEKITETERQTERSERVNDGDKIELSTLRQGLQGAFPYLFAAQEVKGASSLAKEEQIADGDKGRAALFGLENLSEKLADGKSTSKVRVINVYADKDGKLDTKQLKDAFQSETIDVTNQYVVVNVIADQKDQKIDFSGYTMVNADQTVRYTEETQPGDILYNFAWLDGENFAPFEGTVTLTGTELLQGTFLAPEGDVEVKSNLAGAVYADQITVADGVSDLKRIVLIEGAKKSETESTDETSSEPETTFETTVESETETASESAAENESETVSETTAESEPETVSETTAESEPETVAETTAGSETEIASESAAESESETVSETTADSETETAAETEENDMIAIDANLVSTYSFFSTRIISSWNSEEGTELKIKLTDAEDEAEQALAGGEAVVRAADSIYDKEGALVFRKNAEVATLNWKKAAEVSAKFHYSGSYYLEVTKTPAVSNGEEAYMLPSRIYFYIDADGVPVFAENESWYTWKDSVLSIDLAKTEKVQVKLRLTGQKADGKSDGELLSGAAFVLKNEDGQIIRDEEGYPKYYISFNGEEVSLSGLEAGTYLLSEITAPDGYQPAADKKFTIASDTATPVELVVTNAKTSSNTETLEFTAISMFDETVLTSEFENYYYAALFQDKALKKKVSDVIMLTYSEGEKKTESTELSGIAVGTYYLAPTDEFGEPVSDASFQMVQSGETPKENQNYTVLKVKKTETSQTEETQTEKTDSSKTEVALEYQYTEYPSDDFSYEAAITLTKQVKNYDGKAKKVTEDFYAMLYADAEHEEALLEEPVKFELKDASSVKTTVKVSMTESGVPIWIAETDKDGNVITSDNEDFVYAITYPKHADGKFTVICGKETVGTIQNQLNNSIVKIRVEDGSKKLLPGAKLVLKNQKTGEVVPIDQKAVFESTGEELVLENQLENGTNYVLTELTAPDGYQNTADETFTAQEGKTVEVVLTNQKTKGSHTLTVMKTVYSGDHQVYAQDLSSGTYAQEGCYTFYAALYADAKRTEKVSDVKEIKVSGLTGTTSFGKLESGTYYLAETDQYGTVVKSDRKCTIKYTDAGKIQVTGTNTAEIQNVFSELPRGYRYTATLTITKKLQNSAGEAEAASKTFYAGIYRTQDYSDTPTIIPITLNNASEASERRRILLPGTDDLTYYIAEVNEQGQRMTENSEFGYIPTIDQPELAVKKGEDASVTITNKTKVSKVTLYLTKKVYKGNSQYAVNETFYAGLFKDSEFTQLYANPIPMQMNGKSELTLKLTLNLGSSSDAKIYIAEVDKNGKIAKSSKEFGYDIRVVNATASFSQDRTEVQTILLNAVYGTTSDEDWNNIENKDDNNIDGDDGGSGISSNGSGGYGGSGTGSDVATGDETPVLPYVAVLAVSALVILGLVFTSKKKKRRK